jgi:hypothetical protein
MAMRGGTIEQHSPLEMVRNVLVGTWAEYEKNGWHVVTCPLFTVMEKVCQPGPNVLPLTPWRQTYVDIVFDGGSERKLVKPGQTVLNIDQASFVRIAQFGQGDK